MRSFKNELRIASEGRATGVPLWFALFLIALICTPCRQLAAASILIEAAQAWENREKATASFRCEWTFEEVVPAGTQALYNPSLKKSEPYPTADVVLHGEGQLCMLGPRNLRYENSVPQLTFETKSYELRKYVSVTNGKEHSTLLNKPEKAFAVTVPPRGFRYTEVPFGDVGNLALRPLLLLSRPSFDLLAESEESRGLDYDLSQFREVGERNSGSARGVLLERDSGAVKTSIIVDPSKEFLPLVFQEWRATGEGNELWRLSSEVAFRYDSEDRNTVSGWTAAMYKSAKGELVGQITATVKSLSINSPLDEADFVLSFPKGTFVRDLTEGEDTHYIVLENNGRRDVLQAEIMAGVPYDQLLVTEPGEALGLTSTSWRLWIILAVNAAIVAAVCILFYRRRYR